LSSAADDVHDSSWSPSHIGDGFAASVRQFDGAKSSDGTGHITRLASIDSFYSKWYAETFSCWTIFASNYILVEGSWYDVFTSIVMVL